MTPVILSEEALADAADIADWYGASILSQWRDFIAAYAAVRSAWVRRWCVRYC